MAKTYCHKDSRPVKHQRSVPFKNRKYDVDTETDDILQRRKYHKAARHTKINVRNLYILETENI